MIGEPYAIAEIPPGLTGTLDEVFASDVFALSNAGKRKRPEVALAIEHQSINIYDIRISRLVTSYAISPRASVTCAPCSLRIRSSKGQLAQRFTYCSIKAPKSQILGFVEDCTAPNAAGNISTFSLEVEDASPILALEAIPLRLGKIVELAGFRLLAIHQDGHINSYDQDLKQASKLRVPTEQNSEESKFQYAISIHSEQARKSLFKQRDDLSNADPEGQDGSSNSYLLSVSSTAATEGLGAGQFSVEIYKVGVKVTHMLSHHVVAPPSFQRAISKFTLHAASGTLYQETTKGVAIYDLSDPFPHIKQIVDAEGDGVASSLRMNASLIATVTSNIVNVTALPYCSLQARRKLDGQYPGLNSPRRSTNYKDSSSPSRLRLLSFSSQLNMVVALDGRKLVGIPILEAVPLSPSASRKRARDGLLINSIGRGSSISQVAQSKQALGQPPKGAGTKKFRSENDPLWRAQKACLDALSLRKDSYSFDKAMFEALEVADERHSLFDQHKANYLLGQIFCPHGSDSGAEEAQKAPLKVKVVFWPPTSCQWLIQNKLITRNRVESALRQYGKLSLTSQLAASALIDAIAEWDPSLEQLHVLLVSQVPLDPAELTHALAHVFHSIKKNGHSKDVRMLTNGEVSPGIPGEVDQQLLNGRRVEDGSSELVEPPTNQTTPFQRVLYCVLTRLHGYPSSSLTLALRDAFIKPQLRSLVDLLRLEIARNGWLSPYEDQLSANYDDNMSESPIILISHLLNSILDALGPTGWMLGAPADNLTETSETISYMKAEISAALEGIEESTYLKGVLGEILLCGKGSLLPSKQKATTTGGSGSSAHQLKPVTLTLKEENPMLPFGLKLKPPREGIKVGAGGELIQRSKRDMGRLLSRKVGKYSFERIAI